MSLTVEERTQTNSNKGHKSSHSTLTMTQWIRMWYIDFSSHLQRTHLFANPHPLFLNMIHSQHFVVTSLSCKKKKTRFWKEPWIPNDGHGGENCMRWSQNGIKIFDREDLIPRIHPYHTMWTLIFHVRPHSIGETRFLFVKN